MPETGANLNELEVSELTEISEEEDPIQSQNSGLEEGPGGEEDGDDEGSQA